MKVQEWLEADPKGRRVVLAHKGASVGTRQVVASAESKVMATGWAARKTGYGETVEAALADLEPIPVLGATT